MGLKCEHVKLDIKLGRNIFVKKNYIVNSSPFGGRRGVPCISKALTYHHFDTSGGYNNNTDDVILLIPIELLMHRSTVVSPQIFEFLDQCYHSNE